MEPEPVQIYVRNTHKIGKVLSLPPTVTSEQLYDQAAAAHSVQSSRIRLYISGKPLNPAKQAISLTQKMIVHLVNLQEVQKDEIEVNVRMLQGRTHPSKIEVKTTSTVRDFIDHKLYKIYGEKSDNLILIYLGRQLSPETTFLQAEIEDGSELFCVNLQELREKKRKNRASEGDDNIYPSLPQQVNATSNMDLIFDPSIHHSSSIPDYNLAPDEVIPEEQVNLASGTSEKEKSSGEKEKQNDGEMDQLNGGEKEVGEAQNIDNHVEDQPEVEAAVDKKEEPEIEPSGASAIGEGCCEQGPGQEECGLGVDVAQQNNKNQ